MDEFEIFIHEWYEIMKAGRTETEKDEVRKNYELCRRLYHEIIEDAKSIIHLDCNDFESHFTDGGEVFAYECSIDGNEPDRMSKLVDMLKEKTDLGVCPEKMIIYLFIPDKQDLEISELEPINNWLNSYPNDIETKYGIGGNENSKELRIAVLIQYNNLK